MLDNEILILSSRSKPCPAPAAVPCTDLSVHMCWLEALDHQVLLCFPRRFGRGLHPTEQPQCALHSQQGCATQEESTGTWANSHRHQNKDSFFGVGVEELQTAYFPAKTPKGKMSSLLCELTGSPHPLAAPWWDPGQTQALQQVLVTLELRDNSLWNENSFCFPHPLNCTSSAEITSLTLCQPWRSPPVNSTCYPGRKLVQLKEVE